MRVSDCCSRWFSCLTSTYEVQRESEVAYLEKPPSQKIVQMSPDLLEGHPSQKNAHLSNEQDTDVNDALSKTTSDEPQTPLQTSSSSANLTDSISKHAKSESSPKAVHPVSENSDTEEEEEETVATTKQSLEASTGMGDSWLQVDRNNN